MEAKERLEYDIVPTTTEITKQLFQTGMRKIQQWLICLYIRQKTEENAVRHPASFIC
jgi:hypothetical protein